MRWLLTGLVIYAAFLLATLPASFAAWAVPRWTDDRVYLQQPRGTLWRGEADALLVKPGLRLAGVTWRIILWRLLRGEIAVTIQMTGVPAAATIIVGSNKLRLQDADLTVPANATAAWFPQLALLGLDGHLRIRTDDFSLTPGSAMGEAELNWINASSRLSSLNPLGDYRTKFAATGEKAEYQVTTVKGALQLDGVGSWSAREGLSFSGTARADTLYQSQLVDLLRLLSREEAPGVYKLSFARKL